MKNRWLLNIGLTVLIGALVLLAVYRPGARQEPRGTPLTALSTDSIQRIRLLRPKQAPIVLEKTGDDWRLSAPRAARANRHRVNELVQLAATRVPARFPAVPAELGKYGLDHPLATLFLNDAEIRFGGMHPLDNRLYVLHDGQVQLIPGSVLRAAIAPLNDFLNSSLLGEKTKPVAFKFPAFGLKQNEQGAWVRTPALAALSSDRINRFVDEWRYAQALSVAPYAGKPARERVTITVADGDQTRTLEIGVRARKPEFIVVRQDENLEYHFPEDIGSRLMQLKAE
jgi:hypothetical protein